MSSTDKTGDKLLASIRKTKASGGPSETSSTPSAATPKRAVTTKRKVAPKPPARTAAKPAAKPASGPTATAKAPAAAADPFQAARRIWPD